MGSTVCTESQLSDRLNSTCVGSVDRELRVRIWTRSGRYHIDSTAGWTARSALNHSYQTAWTAPGWALWIENWELGYEHSQVDTTLTVQQGGQHGLHWITAIRPSEQHQGGLCQDRELRVRIWTQPGRYHIDSTAGWAARSALNHSYQAAWTAPGWALWIENWELGYEHSQVDTTLTVQQGGAARSVLNHSYQTAWTAPGWALWIENWELGYEHSQVDATLTVQQDGQHGLYWITAIRPPEQHRGGLGG